MTDAEQTDGKSSFGVPQVVEAGKLFIVSVLIAASLEKLGQGLFGYFHRHQEAGGASSWYIFTKNINDISLWQILILGYFILVVLRHAGAMIASTPIFTAAGRPRQSSDGSAWRYIVGITDFSFTLLLFIAHFVVALSLQVHWSEGRTIGNIEPLFFIVVALGIDVLLCGFWAFFLLVLKAEVLQLSETERKELRRLNIGWMIASVIEILLFLMAIISMESSNPTERIAVIICILVAIIVGIADFADNGKHWRKVIEGRFGKD